MTHGRWAHNDNALCVNAKNLGTLFNNTMTLESHVNGLVKKIQVDCFAFTVTGGLGRKGRRERDGRVPLLLFAQLLVS